MTSTLIDTNVLLDLIEGRPDWEEWSGRHVYEARLKGNIVLNPIVYAEASIPYEDADQFKLIVGGAGFVNEDLPWDAAFMAGKAHRHYRERGGVRTQTLPDFFIAAHALVKKYPIISRDASRFRTYFPDLVVIAPDTYP